MPDLVGTELARTILQVRPTLPIVLMSGHGGARLAVRAAKSVCARVRTNRYNDATWPSRWGVCWRPRRKQMPKPKRLRPVALC
jgi:hypothetical protein